MKFFAKNCFIYTGLPKTYTECRFLKKFRAVFSTLRAQKPTLEMLKNANFWDTKEDKPTVPSQKPTPSVGTLLLQNLDRFSYTTYSVSPRHKPFRSKKVINGGRTLKLLLRAVTRSKLLERSMLSGCRAEATVEKMC